jgi:hypothetical protein
VLGCDDRIDGNCQNSNVSMNDSDGLVRTGKHEATESWQARYRDQQKEKRRAIEDRQAGKKEPNYDRYSINF